LPLYEIVLDDSGSLELRLTDEHLAVGDILEIAMVYWRVTGELQPSAGATARFQVKRARDQRRAAEEFRRRSEALHKRHDQS
jgi:hypothetical protein